MLKKIVLLGLALIMMLSMAGCGQNNGLAKYKAKAKTKLESHVQSLDENDYIAEDWIAMQGLLQEGKAAINKAKDKARVDLKLAAVKQTIDAIEDLKMPQITPLSEEMKSEIKQERLRQFDSDYCGVYYGEYSGAFVFFHAGQAQVVRSFTIEGVIFSCSTSFSIEVYKDRIFYEIKDAYLNDILSPADLRVIGLHHLKEQMSGHKDKDADIVEGYLNFMRKPGSIVSKTDEYGGLDEEIGLQIGSDYLAMGGYPYILAHYGTFNGSVVITACSDIMPTPFVETAVIGGVKFKFSAWSPVVWRDGQFYSLQQAYESGFLTQSDLIEIETEYSQFAWFVYKALK